MEALKHFPEDVRLAVFDRCRMQCERCGRGSGVELHHRRPKGMGGSRRADTNTASNCLAVCSWCHQWIHAHPDVANARGWILKQHEVPTETPAFIGSYAFALFDDEGGMTYVDGDSDES